MKLLSVGSAYWPAFSLGGPILSSHNLHIGLKKYGVDVTVYTTNLGLADRVPLNREVDVDGIGVTYFPFSKYFEFTGPTGWQFSTEMTKALRNAIPRYDLISIGGVWDYPVAAAAYYCRKFKKPYVIFPHGLLYPETFGKKAWKKWPYYKLIAHKVLNSASAIHFTTLDEAERCSKFVGERTKSLVIPNSIQLAKFTNQPKEDYLRTKYPVLEDKKIILFLSRLNWKKGLDLLIDAFGRIAKTRSDVFLVIVGEDDGDGYRNVISRRISDSNLSSKVIMTGALYGTEKDSAYVYSDVFALSSYSENFGMVVVEAMAWGVPVLISNKVGLWRDVVARQAGLVSEANADDVYLNLKKLIENDALCGKLRENGLKMAGSFDVDNIGRQAYEAYAKIAIDGSNSDL